MSIFVVYTLLAISGLWIIIQDTKDQTIPKAGLALFVGVTILKHFFDPNPEGLWAAGTISIIFLSCFSILYLFKKRAPMGWGDLLLAPLCGFWLHIQDIPLFLFTTGLVACVIGLFWHYRWGMRTFPLTPAIVSGLGVVFLIRCFLTVSGI
jgi:hypothetical protein